MSLTRKVVLRMKPSDLGFLITCAAVCLLVTFLASGCTRDVATAEDPYSVVLPVTDKASPEMAVLTPDSEVD